MAEVKRIEEEIPSSELATYGIPREQTDGPHLVKAPQP